MTDAPNEQSLRVIVAQDRMSATLVLPAGFPAAMLTEDVCINLIRTRGVVLDQNSLTIIKGIVAGQPESDGPPREFVVAKGSQPVDGTDGHVEWDDQGEPATEEQTAELSHYERSPFVMVKEGQSVGRVVPETLGTDGADVLGATLNAKHGKPPNLSHDETVIRDASGQLIAQIDGVLHRTPDNVKIRNRIEITEYVDFSTGNINFTGDVLVLRGVRDCFTVKTTGNVEVRGLIEAATIDCDGDLNAIGGMAGRERGTLRISGNMTGKFLDNIAGRVGGSLELHSEMVNCDIAVGGELRVPKGKVIGGRVCVAGPANIATLGSAACVSTEIVLGSAAELTRIERDLLETIDQLTRKHDAANEELDVITRNTRRLTAFDRERQTELMYEAGTIKQQIDRGTAAYEALTKHLKAQRVVDMTVTMRVFEGVTITIDGLRYQILEQIRGPVWIGLARDGKAVYRQGSSADAPLSGISQVSEVAPAGK